MNPNDEKSYPQVNTQEMHGYTPPIMYDGVNLDEVIMEQPTTIIIQTPQFGPDSQNSTCPNCKAYIRTRVIYEPSSSTHLNALRICLAGCIAGCCLIPYYVDSCQNANHSCPNCGTYLGTYSDG